MSNLINENSFYQNDTEKTEFLDKGRRATASVFWTTLLGILALKKVYPSESRITRYFKNDLRIRISTITDGNNDFSLIIKILLDQGMIKPKVAKELTRIVARFKVAPDTTVNENILRDTLQKVPYSKLWPSAKIHPYIKAWLNGSETLNSILPHLYSFAKRNEISQE